jgi:hypothetical protein
MNQRGSLQGLTGRFPRHLLCGQLAQLLVNEWEQFMSGLRIALLQALKDDGEFGHAGIINRFRRGKEAKNPCLALQ